MLQIEVDDLHDIVLHQLLQQSNQRRCLVWLKRLTSFLCGLWGINKFFPPFASSREKILWKSIFFHLARYEKAYSARLLVLCNENRKQQRRKIERKRSTNRAQWTKIHSARFCSKLFVSEIIDETLRISFVQPFNVCKPKHFERKKFLVISQQLEIHRICGIVLTEIKARENDEKRF